MEKRKKRARFQGIWSTGLTEDNLIKKNLLLSRYGYATIKARFSGLDKILTVFTKRQHAKPHIFSNLHVL